MLRHVVLIRWVEGTTAEQVEAVAAGLRELPGLIPEIAAYHVGADLGLNDGNAQFAVTADFHTTADYLVYRDHPEHTARIASLIRPHLAERQAVQLDLTP